MILIDANLLVYLVDRGAPRPGIVQLAGRDAWRDPPRRSAVFLHTRFRASHETRQHPAAPLWPDQTLAYVQPSLAQHFVYAVAPGKRNWPFLRNLFRVTGSAGSQTTDSHIAAIAIEHGPAVFSTDHDFERVPGVHLGTR